MTRSPRHWLLAALFLALSLRLVNIGTEPLWGDEILSLDVIQHFSGDTRGMLSYLREVEVHPPLFYLMMGPWIAAFGDSAAALRTPSLLFSLAVVALAYALAVSLFADRRAGVLAAFVTALLPLQIEFGQEARPYAMLCFFGALTTLCLWRSLRGDGRWVIGYAAASALGLYTHYSFLFVLLPLSGWWLYEITATPRGTRLRGFRAWLLTHSGVFLAFFWWLDAFLYKLLLSRLALADLPPRFDDAFKPVDFFEKIVVQSVWATKQKALIKAEILAQALVKILAVWFFVELLKTRRKALSAKTVGRRFLPTAVEGRPWLFLGWLFVAPLVLFLFSPQSFQYAPFHERHVLFVTVPLAVALGRFLSLLPPKRATALGAVFAASLLPRVADVAGNDALWDRNHRIEEAAGYLNGQWRPGDLALMGWTVSRTNFSHYLRPEIEPVPLLPTWYDGTDVWRSRETLGFVENEIQARLEPVDPEAVGRKLERLIAEGEPNRVWLYAFDPLDKAVAAWFQARGWRHPIRSIRPLSPIDLFVRSGK
jgi:4-amino-4-deoxy-L-arabinose transferase-like glycosyltransferase